MEKIDYFIIQAVQSNGDVWETIRHTKEGMEVVLKDIIADKDVVRFSVEEQYYA